MSKKLLAVNFRWNGSANVCAHCGKLPIKMNIVTGHDHTDDYATLCDCGAGEPFSKVYARVKNPTHPLSHYLQSIAQMESAIASEPTGPTSQWINDLRVLTGIPFEAKRVDDLNGKPLFVGDVILDKASGLHCVVYTNEMAIRQGYTAWRKNGCWRKARKNGKLEITHDEAGDLSALRWRGTFRGSPLDELVFNKAPSVVKIPSTLGLPAPKHLGPSMTPEQFCYWLQGRAELVAAAPTAEEWASIKEHLNLVFNKVTAPGPGDLLFPPSTLQKIIC
ncbi:SAM-dependent methyltransferase [Novimethylophilus kurashikiensis]|uniref:SAM-dependent methyltransferase n=1 Tax=Novimethylophilus kurashikiensis TaxID=1825523 RepID=A0A2R5FD09_9PROT|nr:hypothetical protein [Novimethylophilus kurashikiensis]GBG14803.1 SAM-dependent methyltransferase [Novimethylophilus kurashikiensis]